MPGQRHPCHHLLPPQLLHHMASVMSNFHAGRQAFCPPQANFFDPRAGKAKGIASFINSRKGMTARLLLIAGLIAAPLASLLSPASAGAAVIGVVAPQRGPFATLGAQILAAPVLPQQPPATSWWRLTKAVTTAVARPRPKPHRRKVNVAIGFLCVETLTGSLPQLRTAPYPPSPFPSARAS